MPNSAELSKTRFMYHCFPRRRGVDDDYSKGLRILELIAEYGLLLTPEMETWKDRKTAPSPAEEYTVVAKRCCFTEIGQEELQRHTRYFGQFALEFETRVLCDLGALPVFYVPRTTDSDGYGPGAAIVTQLAHVQELLERVATFREFANSVGGPHPQAPVLVKRAEDGGLVVGIPDGLSLTIPGEIVARAAKVNPAFKLEIPTGVSPLGLTAGTLMSIFNILHWGLHQPDVLTGTIKAMGSLFYSTERADDPFLSHYQQREWRIIANVKKDSVEICRPVPPELRRRLVDLDRAFFERVLPFRTGPAAIVDQSRIFSETSDGLRVGSFLRRVIVPSAVISDAQRIMSSRELGAEVVGLDEFPANEGVG